MNRRYIFIIIIVLIVAGVIAFNAYLFSEKNNHDDGLLVVNNDTIKRQHCSTNICLDNLQVILDKSVNFVCIAGTIKNSTSVNYSGDIEIIFDTAKGKSTVKTKVNLGDFEEQYFETHDDDQKLLKPIDYTIREVN